jgi:uncharacterized protein YjbI with pentapeptide repeats
MHRVGSLFGCSLRPFRRIHLDYYDDIVHPCWADAYLEHANLEEADLKDDRLDFSS